MTELSEKESIRKRVRDIKAFYNVEVSREVESDKFKWASGVCCDDNGFLYLTCVRMRKLLVFNNELECIKDVSLDRNPGYIVHFKGKLYITFSADKSIGIYDLEGNVIGGLEDRLSGIIEFHPHLFAMGAGENSLVLVDFSNNELHFIDENNNYSKKIHVKDFTFQEASVFFLRKILFLQNELFMLDLNGNVYSVSENGNAEIVFKPGGVIRDATDFLFLNRKINIIERALNQLYIFDRSKGDYIRWRIDFGNVNRMASRGNKLLIPASSHGAMAVGSKSRILEITLN